MVSGSLFLTSIGDGAGKVFEIAGLEFRRPVNELELDGPRRHHRRLGGTKRQVGGPRRHISLSLEPLPLNQGKKSHGIEFRTIIVISK